MTSHAGLGLAEQTRPEPIKAVPVRHPGRWVAVAVLAVLAAMFVHMLVTNTQFQWRFIFENVMFTPPRSSGPASSRWTTGSPRLRRRWG